MAKVSNKTQVNWRIRNDVLDALRADVRRLGLNTVPDVVNHLFVSHYYGNKHLDNISTGGSHAE